MSLLLVACTDISDEDVGAKIGYDTGAADGSSTDDTGDGADADSGVESADDTAVDSASDSGDTDTDSGSVDTAQSCDDCFGITRMDPETSDLQADGVALDASSVTLHGWATGLSVRCDTSLAHLSASLNTTDTSTSGEATIILEASSVWRGTETGSCWVQSDQNSAPLELPVTLSPCPTCTGITSADWLHLALFTSSTSYPTGYSNSTKFYGTATGITVTCDTSSTGLAHDFAYSISTTDTSSTGVGTFDILLTDARYMGTEWGLCEISSEQAPVLTICVWENNGVAGDPC